MKVKAEALRAGDLFLYSGFRFCKVVNIRHSEQYKNGIIVEFIDLNLNEDSRWYFFEKDKELILIPKESLETYKVLYGH